MLKIRLQRHGKKKQPIYRIVVAEDNWPQLGKYLEVLGYFNPLTDPKRISLNEERIRFWLNHGAKVSPAVAKLLYKFGSKKIVSDFEINKIVKILRKKPPKAKKEKKEKEEKPKPLKPEEVAKLPEEKIEEKKEKEGKEEAEVEVKEKPKEEEKEEIKEELKEKN